jgi:all-trans-8'-apo-beta-carotenal 15,15'-oxygenase
MLNSVTVQIALSDRPWALGFNTIAGEIPDEVALPFTGVIPHEVRGTLYRVGPAQFDVAGDRYRHWFDGDSMVHAIALGTDGVRYRSRWVDTEGRRAEQAAGLRIFAGGFATPAPGGPLARLRHARPKNVANINVVAHAGKLHALWEGGRPHRLDPDDLITIGEDDLGGLLAANDGFSAHPKPDPQTGEVWNFGITYGPRTHLSIYRADSEGRWSRVARHPLPHPYMVHDMALTATSVVFVLVPVALPTIPLGLVTGRRGYAESLRYRPGWGTTVLVIDRDSGRTRDFHTEPFMVFHLAGAGEDDGVLEVDLCTYPDSSVITALGQVMNGDPPEWRPTLERLRIDKHGQVARTRLADLPFEFPRRLDASRLVGLTSGADTEFLNAPVVVDVNGGSAVAASLSASEFAGEVVPVAGKYGLTIVLDAKTQSSELRVLDLSDLTASPLAVARLPHVVPFGLHGNFVRSA